jgi:hypothetical protein
VSGHIGLSDEATTSTRRIVKMTARVFAQIVGVVLLLLGVLGLLLGDQLLLGLVNIDIVEDIIHLLSMSPLFSICLSVRYIVPGLIASAQKPAVLAMSSYP